MSLDKERAERKWPGLQPRRVYSHSILPPAHTFILRGLVLALCVVGGIVIALRVAEAVGFL